MLYTQQPVPNYQQRYKQGTLKRYSFSVSSVNGYLGKEQMKLVLRTSQHIPSQEDGECMRSHLRSISSQNHETMSVLSVVVISDCMGEEFSSYCVASLNRVLTN